MALVPGQALHDLTAVAKLHHQEGPRVRAGQQRAGRVAIVLGGQGPAGFVVQQVADRHGHLLTHRGRRLGGGQAGAVPQAEDIGELGALQSSLVHLHEALRVGHGGTPQKPGGGHGGPDVQDVEGQPHRLGWGGGVLRVLDSEDGRASGPVRAHFNGCQRMAKALVNATLLTDLLQAAAVLLDGEHGPRRSTERDVDPLHVVALVLPVVLGHVHGLLGCSAALGSGGGEGEEHSAVLVLGQAPDGLPGALAPGVIGHDPILGQVLLEPRDAIPVCSQPCGQHQIVVRHLLAGLGHNLFGRGVQGGSVLLHPAGPSGDDALCVTL
mmetsp:Transcript_147369/g.257593  ORF Transcript_147369/g.257593 Transcript_147369/m.257593 type:complete len:324 (-) Transcript_147369:291-1262(-)